MCLKIKVIQITIKNGGNHFRRLLFIFDKEKKTGFTPCERYRRHKIPKNVFANDRQFSTNSSIMIYYAGDLGITGFSSCQNRYLAS